MTEHEIRLAVVPFEWPGYIAVCSCQNYTSGAFERRADAERAGKHHVAEWTRKVGEIQPNPPVVITTWKGPARG